MVDECIQTYRSFRDIASRYLNDDAHGYDEHSVTRNGDSLLASMVPFANNGAGGYAFLDYDPPPGRSIGQIVYVFPAIRPDLIADSLEDLIERSVHCIEGGLLYFDADEDAWKTAQGRDLFSLWDLG